MNCSSPKDNPIPIVSKSGVEEKRFSLGEHLEELKNRLIYALVAFGAALVICFVYQNEIMAIICRPHFQTTSSTLKMFSYPEGFTVYFKSSLIAAAILAAPFALYQLWKFISVGLYPRERKYVMFYLPFSLLLFAAGVAFGYFILIPMGLKFLFIYAPADVVEPVINLNDYFNLFVILTLIVGAMFELPLLMLFFAQIGLLTPKIYVANFKIAVILAFVIAAIVTPTGDPFNQSLLAVPLLLLYGLGILLSLIFVKRSVAV
ncbi:MAG: twin-arginine translocase subunit TatC [Planctomycetes bacterium]|nr:twin-arginine translocase subunit TatC [Planctomycetota bacterium]